MLAATRTGIVSVNISLRSCSLRRNGRVRHPISFLQPSSRSAGASSIERPCALQRGSVVPACRSQNIHPSRTLWDACAPVPEVCPRASIPRSLRCVLAFSPSSPVASNLLSHPDVVADRSIPTVRRNGDCKLSCRHGGEASLAILVESRRGCGHDGRQRRTPQRELGDASTG